MLLERSRLFPACVLLQPTFFRIRRQRLIDPRVHEHAPVEIGHVRLPLLPAEHLAADDLPALYEPLHLVGALVRARCYALDNRIERLLASVEHVLAEGARRLECALPRTSDDPAPGQQRVPIGCGLLEQVHDQCAHTPRVRRILNKARLQQGELLAHRLIREHAPVHCGKGDRVSRAPVALEEEVGIAQELGIGGLDIGLPPRCRVVDPERLILRDRAAAEELEQGSPLVGEALPAFAQPDCKRSLATGPPSWAGSSITASTSVHGSAPPWRSCRSSIS